LSVGSHGQVWVTGEVTTLAININILTLVKRIAGPDLSIRVHVVSQPPEMVKAVDTSDAGDQGIMTVYDAHETATYMPREYELARSLC